MSNLINIVPNITDIQFYNPFMRRLFDNKTYIFVKNDMFKVNVAIVSVVYVRGGIGHMTRVQFVDYHWLRQHKVSPIQIQPLK